MTTRATLGARTVAKVPVTTNQGFKNLVLDKSVADSGFMYHLFEIISSELERRASGTTFPEVSGKQFGEIEVALPPLREQRRITEILDIADSQISATSIVVDKLRLMHRGVMHDALSNGTARAAEETGGWSLAPVADAGSVKLGRQRSPQHETGRHMTPYLRVANVFDGYIDYSDVLEMNFTPAEQEEYSLRDGDILLNEGQSLELVGRSAIYDGPPGYCFQNTLVRFRPHRISPEFAQAVFSYWLSIGEFTKIAKQTTSIAHLGADRFVRMKFPVPPAEEERKITASIGSVATAIKAETHRAASLKLLKQGLMEDLLTGRVRVSEAEAVLENL
ncbi:restriction endonuclease subunit S [Sphaerimonospora sp. CA-214678]|uniref:restriction endonuclease subunit S n=1 Tax=Sphaerimonospora sp. CA-214678 TaxID=3240029 RepID=UPI003D8F1722